MADTAVILDCYTVEPSGLGVPPYISTYVRDAYSAVRRALPDSDVRYLTIDDVRWCINGGEPLQAPPLSDSSTYSATTNRADTLELIADADVVVVIAGDKVPSVHLHAQNGTVDEIGHVLSYIRGRRILLGPLSTYAFAEPHRYRGLFDAVHSHTVLSDNLFSGSRTPATYTELREERTSLADLLSQLTWPVIAEIEMYRGCTRRRFCSFCNEPVKNPLVSFREPADILHEITLLYGAGIRHFRLGQQTCFFSYHNRDSAVIGGLLRSIRESCPELEVLHIDNADPLAVASRSGARIAKLVAEYCTEGNCAPMGIESFDPAVVAANSLTCTPDILKRAVATINNAGATTRVNGLPQLLPGLNLVYGLPGETRRTHFTNLVALTDILAEGLLCHRTNVRQARAFPGTALAASAPNLDPPSTTQFEAWKQDIAELFEIPMKQRVYPAGLTIEGLHSFFVSSRGTWYRRLGSYSIQVVEEGHTNELYRNADLRVTGHANRYVIGERVAS